VPAGRAAEGRIAVEDLAYGQLKRKIGQLLAIDLEAYKAPQMRRRIETFVSKQTDDEGIPAFTRGLDQQPEMLAELRNMLTINVSEFFRDPSQWERLQNTILPGLLEKERRLRIWSAACSNGQEPFSIAMLLDELGAADRAHIVATDMDRRVLERARAGGPYPTNELKQINAGRWAAYMEERADGVYVTDAIRKRPRFSEINLLSGRFEKSFHLIVCRHVMIYFSPEVKSALLQRFAASLVPGGYLFIGGTESLVGAERDGFQLAQGNFYQRSESGQLRSAA